MVETLTNLKNNKVKKAASSGAGVETIDRLKKFLSGLSKKRHGTPLPSLLPSSPPTSHAN